METRTTNVAAATESAATIVAEAVRLEPAGGLARWLQRKGVKVPREVPGMALLFTAQCSGGRTRVARDEIEGAEAADPWAIRICTEPWIAALTIGCIKRDAAGHDHDLTINVAWHVADPAAFVDGVALAAISPEASLAVEDVADAILSHVEHLVRDALASPEISLEDLRDRAFRPPPWWSTKLGEWLAPLGLAAAVSHVKFHGASAAAAEEQRLRQHRQQEMDEERREMRERERRDAQEVAETQRLSDEAAFDRERIESDRTLDRARRETRLKVVADREQAIKEHAAQRQVQAKLQQEQASLRIQQMKARHEQKLAHAHAFAADECARQARKEQTDAEDRRLRQQREAERHTEEMKHIAANTRLTDEQRQTLLRQEQIARDAARQAVEVAQRQAEEAHMLHAAQMELCRAETERARLAAGQDRLLSEHLVAQQQNMREMLASLVSMIKDLVGGNATATYNAAATLTHRVGMGQEMFQAMGVELPPQSLVDAWTAKAKAEGHPVQISKRDLATRDIGVTSMRVLRIGQTLNFRLTVARSGYVTLLNLGTSGAFFLLCPGALCGSRRARVESGRSYELPGSELFPFDGRLVEQGPVGWEHLVAIVSDEPLFDATLSGPPVVEIHASRMKQLTQRLEAAITSWTVGIVSFHVE